MYMLLDILRTADRQCRLIRVPDWVIYTGRGTSHTIKSGNRIYSYAEAIATGEDLIGLARLLKLDPLVNARTAAREQREQREQAQREAEAQREAQEQAVRIAALEAESRVTYALTTLRAAYAAGWVEDRPVLYGGDVAYLRGHVLRRGGERAQSMSAWRRQQRAVTQGAVPHATDSYMSRRWPVYRRDQTTAIAPKLRLCS